MSVESESDFAAWDREWLVKDLERSRVVYERGNFVGLMHALYCCQKLNIFPDWVASGCRKIIDTEIDEGVGLVGRWSRKYHQDLIDVVRAQVVSGAREHGFTWDEACEFTAEFFQPSQAGAAGKDAMFKSWERVKKQGGPNALDESIDRLCWGSDDPRASRYATWLSVRKRYYPSDEHQHAVWTKWVARLIAAGREITSPDALWG